MEIRIARVDDAYHFRATNANGKTVDTDLTEADGGKASSATPLELMLVGLGSCSGVDVISILEKGKQQVDKFSAVVTAERDGGKPISMITSMHVRFDLTGDLEPGRVARAVNLSLDKYCTVAKILSATMRISASYSINGTEYDNAYSS